MLKLAETIVFWRFDRNINEHLLSFLLLNVKYPQSKPWCNVLALFLLIVWGGSVMGPCHPHLILIP